MKVDKMSISMDPALAEDARRAAAREGQSVSAWIADAVAAKLRRASLDEFFREYEAEHGAFTAEELEAARRELGLPPRDPA